MRGRLVLSIACLLVLAAAAALDATRPRRFADPRLSAGPIVRSAVRTVHTPRWHSQWIRGGDADSLLLLAPTRVSGTDATTYLLDAAARRVIAFDAATGTMRWRSSPADSLVAPMALSAIPVGPSARGVGVLDASAKRLVIYGPNGLGPRMLSLAKVAPPLAICAYGDGSWLVATTAESSALTRVTAEGEVRWQRPLPWASLRAAPVLARQVMLAPSPSGATCLAALVFGQGVARIDSSGTMQTFEYIEPGTPAQVQQSGSLDRRTERLQPTQPSALDISMSGAHIFILGAGKTPLAGRVLDVYDATSGAYQRSVRLPWPTAAAHVTAGAVTALHLHQGAPLLERTRPPRGL